MNISRFPHEPMPRFTQIIYVFRNPPWRAESVFWEREGCVSKNPPYMRLRSAKLLAVISRWREIKYQ
jgi:hypothetical protein